MTGRRLDDLLHVCDCIDLFDYVVAENGALVYDPRSGDITLLADPTRRPVCSLRYAVSACRLTKWWR